MIDWRDFAVWVDEAALDGVGERVLDFHERLTDREFVNLQRECRRVWERFLRPEGFFENLTEHFEVAEACLGTSREPETPEWA
jgi:hypothetical protein